VVDCWQNPAMSAVLLEHGMSPAPAEDRSNNRARTWCDVLGHSDNNHDAMERWRQRKAERRGKRSQKFPIHCGDASPGGEQTDAQHGCSHLSVSSVASRITSFGRSLHKSSIHSPLTDRGTLSEDSASTTYLQSQLIDINANFGVKDINANSVSAMMGVTEITCGKTIRRVWSLESCGN